MVQVFETCLILVEKRGRNAPSWGGCQMKVLFLIFICLFVGFFGIESANAAVPDVGSLADSFTNTVSGPGGHIATGSLLGAYLVWLSAQ